MSKVIKYQYFILDTNTGIYEQYFWKNLIFPAGSSAASKVFIIYEAI